MSSQERLRTYLLSPADYQLLTYLAICRSAPPPIEARQPLRTILKHVPYDETIVSGMLAHLVKWDLVDDVIAPAPGAERQLFSISQDGISALMLHAINSQVHLPIEVEDLIASLEAYDEVFRGAHLSTEPLIEVCAKAQACAAQLHHYFDPQAYIASYWIHVEELWERRYAEVEKKLDV